MIQDTIDEGGKVTDKQLDDSLKRVRRLPRFFWMRGVDLYFEWGRFSALS